MRKDIIQRKEEILEWISCNYSIAEMSRRLDCKVDTLKSYFRKLEIDYKGNLGANCHMQTHNYCNSRKMH